MKIEGNANRKESSLSDSLEEGIFQVLEGIILIILSITGGHLFANLLLRGLKEDLIQGEEVSFLVFLFFLVLWRLLLYWKNERQKRALDFEAEQDPNLIRISLQTPLMIFLMVLMIPGGALILTDIFLFLLGEGLISGWIAKDVIVLFLASFVIWSFTKCEYLINPVSKIIRYYYLNPFYSEKRIISFKEVVGVAVGGQLKGWPLFLK